MARTRACLHSTQVRSLIIALLFFLSLLPKLRRFGVCFITLLILFSAFVSHFKFSTTAVLFSPFPLQSFSSSPSLSFCHSVMPPFLSLSIMPPFLSVYHTTSVHFFASMLLRYSLCFFFFFLVLCLLLCLVLGVWVVRKHGKQRDFLGFLIFIGFVNILWVSGVVNFFSLFAFL